MRLIYEVGLADIEDPEFARIYEEMRRWPEDSPEKHEMAAHLLLLAVREEWEAARRYRSFYERDAQRKRTARQAARKRAERKAIGE